MFYDFNNNGYCHISPRWKMWWKETIWSREINESSHKQLKPELSVIFGSMHC